MRQHERVQYPHPLVVHAARQCAMMVYAPMPPRHSPVLPRSPRQQGYRPTSAVRRLKRAINAVIMAEPQTGTVCDLPAQHAAIGLQADRMALLDWVIRNPGIRSSGTAVAVFSHLLFELDFDHARPRKIAGLAYDLRFTDLRVREALRRLVEHGALRLCDTDARGVMSFTLARRVGR